MTARTLTEAQVQAPVVAALRACNWRFIHFRPALTASGRWVTAYTGDDGFPDIIAVKNGRLLVLECKGSRGKKPGPNVRSASQIKLLIRWQEQEMWLSEFAKASAYAVFVTPDNLDEVLEVIAR